MGVFISNYKNLPFEPNMSELWKQLATNNELGLRMLYALDKAQLLGLLTANAKNYKYLIKPDKVFLGNPNLMHVLCPHVEKGNERECPPYFIDCRLVSRGGSAGSRGWRGRGS